jgi:hypothetical protein
LNRRDQLDWSALSVGKKTRWNAPFSDIFQFVFSSN